MIMIHAHQEPNASFIVVLDAVEQIALSKLGDAYCLSNDDMLVACINKGIDIIGGQARRAGRPATDSHGCPHSG